MRILVPSCLIGVLMFPAAGRAQKIDHLEVLEAPRLVDCADVRGRPYFRVVVNAVDAQRRPVGVGLSQEQAKKSFQVTERDRADRVVYVGLFESGGPVRAQGTGSYFMLLLDTSGSMNSRVPSGQTRFAEAKAAITRSLTNFTADAEHIAVVPFNSQNVVSRIRGASFQSTRQGITDQLETIPRPQANTALYTAVIEGLTILKRQADAGDSVSLVVFSDGQNDVGRPGDDRGLLGPEGLAKVKEFAAQVKIPITTVGFGVSGNTETVRALREIAWPSSDSFYNAETNPERLTEIFTIARKKIADRIHILYDPARNGRDNLAGQSLAFRVNLKTPDGLASTTSESAWNAPAVGVPVFEGKCDAAELKALIDDTPAGRDVREDTGWPIVLAVYGALLAGLWFGAPRLVWPESYIPKPPVFNRPASGIPEVDALRAPAFTPSSRAAGGPGQRSPGAGGASSPPRRPAPGDQTVVIPPRSAARPAAPPRAAPQPPSDRGASDETIYRPIDKDPRKGR
jgi:hypothetical protein